MSQKSKGWSSDRPPRVVVYSGADVSNIEGSFYFLNLFWRLTACAKERGWEAFPVMERRSYDDACVAPQEIVDLIEKGGVDGLVGFMITDLMANWITELGIPFVALGGGEALNRINYDIYGMISSSFARFAELSCRSVGLIVPYQFGEADLLEFIDESARKQGLEINFEWILVTSMAWDVRGYDHFRSLWGMKSRPEGLLVYPDVTARGVVTAALELGVGLPRDLKLILHRNKEMCYNAPIACDWLESSADEMARALLGQLCLQMEGRALEPILLQLKMIKGY